MLDFLFVRQNPHAVRGRARNLAENRAHSGSMWIESDTLIFEALDARVAFPLDDLKVSRNRWLGGPIRITNRHVPDWVLLTRDPRVFTVPDVSDDLALVRAAERCRVHFHTARRTLKLALLALLLVVVFVAPARHFLSARAVRAVPVKYEIDLGEKAFAQHRAKLKFINDPKALAQFEIITSRVLEGLSPEERDFPLQFHLVSEPVVNAYAFPGGHIVVNSGLILDAEDADEVAGVLAHEVGHVIHRHSLSQMAETLGTWALLSVVVGRKLESDALVLASYKFSRDHESDADACAWKCTRRAELDSTALARFFERLEKKEKQAKSEQNELDVLLRSHPLTKERVEALRHLAAEAPHVPARMLRVDFKDFQATVRGFQAAN